MSSVVCSGSVGWPETQGIRRNSGIKLKTFWVEHNGLRNRSILLIRLLTFFQDMVEKIRWNTVNAARPSYSESSRELITEFNSVTEEEILKLLMLSPNKQSSLDSLPTWLFNTIGVDVAPFLVALFSRSFEEGYVPWSFRKNIMTPLIKEGELDVDDLYSFRPISNASLVSKMLERLVCERINIHLGKIGTLH